MNLNLTCILLALSFAVQAETINEAISFESRGRRGEAISLKAELRIPKGGTPPFKVIILQHSSGPDVPLKTFNGKTDGIARLVGDMAVKRNYAVIFTDSFTPRGMKESHRIDSEDIGSRDIVRDLVVLLRTIRSDPRLDKSQTYFFGHSLGGAVARDVSYPEIWDRARWLNGRPTPFRAVVASAPGCHLNREGSVGQPLKIFVGADDDWTPAKSCVAYIESQKDLGAPDVEIEVIPNVGHTYSSTGTSWHARAISFRGCVESPVTMRRDGRFFQAGVEITYEEYVRRCNTQGATSRGPSDKASLVATQALDFFEKFHRRQVQ